MAAGSVTVDADWDDIDAAIDRAAPSAAVAPVASRDESTPDARVRMVELLALDGQVARVRFEGGTGDGPAPITIEGSFGRPNDPGRAAALVRFIADELEALAGREIAPR